MEPKCEAERSILGHRSSSRRRLDLVHWSDLRDACLDALCRVSARSSAHPGTIGLEQPVEPSSLAAALGLSRGCCQVALERIHQDSATQER